MASFKASTWSLLFLTISDYSRQASSEEGDDDCGDWKNPKRRRRIAIGMEKSPKSMKSLNANEAQDTRAAQIAMEMQSRSRLLILDLDLFLIGE
jgi:hypothetical protein